MGFRKIKDKKSEIKNYKILYIKVFDQNDNGKKRYAPLNVRGDYLEDEWGNFYELENYINDTIYIKI